MDNKLTYEQIIRMQMRPSTQLFPIIENLHNVNLKIIGDIFVDTSNPDSIKSVSGGAEFNEKIIFFL